MNKREHLCLKLNLGCGRRRHEGFVNIDKQRLAEADMIWNLERTPMPFKPNSVSEIVCEHVLEHINNFMPLMEDIHRVCKPCALVKVTVPYFRYEGAFRDPTHVRFFSEHSFDYFCNGHSYNFYTKARFRLKKVELRTNFRSSTRNLHKSIIKFVPFKRLLNPFLWNMYSEVYFELEVLK